MRHFLGSDKMSTIETPAITDDPLATDEVCHMCTHPRSAHDVISARYCAATAAGALTRGCVCPRDN